MPRSSDQPDRTEPQPPRRRPLRSALQTTLKLVLLLGAVGGAALLAILILTRTGLSPAGDPSAAGERDFQTARALQRLAEDGPGLTQQQISTEARLTSSANYDARMRALSALSVIRAQPIPASNASMTVALNAARRHLHDPEAVVRQYALRCLEMLGAPDIRAAAAQLANDPNDYVSDKAH